MGQLIKEEVEGIGGRLQFSHFCCYKIYYLFCELLKSKSKICTSSSMVLGDRDSIRGRACSNFREFVAAPLVERASSLCTC